MKSGVLPLIAVAVVSKRRSRVGSQEQSKAEGKQEQGRTDGARAIGQQELKRRQKDPKEKNGATPKKVEEAQPPKRDKDQGHLVRLSAFKGSIKCPRAFTLGSGAAKCKKCGEVVKATTRC